MQVDIPGSSSILVEMDGKRILYTGDINSTQTRLLSPIDPTEFPEIDAVITECTYGTIDHQNRIEIEDDLHKSIQDVIDNKGMVHYSGIWSWEKPRNINGLIPRK